MKITNLPIGDLVDFKSHYIFWGNKHSSIEEIKNTFKDFSLRQIKQVHGDNIIMSSFVSENIMADAHFTKGTSISLSIKTADCLPIFIYCSKLRFVAAIHAGWRGVANKITIKTVQKLIRFGCDLSEMQFYIGPHICKESFEVDTKTKNLIVSSLSSECDESVKLIGLDKYSVDLEQIVKQQLYELGYDPKQVKSFSKDTKTNPNYHSYRRDKEHAGRQFSFIVLI